MLQLLSLSALSPGDQPDILVTNRQAAITVHPVLVKSVTPDSASIPER